MGQFSYKAVNKGGGHVRGTIEASDRRSAVVALANKGQFVTDLAEAAQAPGVNGGPVTSTIPFVLWRHLVKPSRH